MFDRERTALTSTFVLDLIKAEEKYLEVCGWTKETGGEFPISNSMWSNPQFQYLYVRNHAVLVCKASDPNMGIQ